MELSAGYYQADLAKTTILAHLIDTSFGYMMLSENKLSVEDFLSLIELRNIDLSDARNNLNTLHLLSRSRAHVQRRYGVLAGCWPGILDTVTMLLQVDPCRSLSIPYSILLSLALNSLLKHYAEDKTMKAAILLSCSIFNISLDDLQLISSSAYAQSLDIIKKHHNKWKVLKANNGHGDNHANEALTAEGHIEKLLIHLDFQSEQSQSFSKLCSVKRSILESAIVLEVLESCINNNFE